MTRALAWFVAVVAVVALGACSTPKPPTSPPAPMYGQILPETFCDEFDFAPLVAALDAGQVRGTPFLNHSGIENRWYTCSVTTVRREGPDHYHYATIGIRVELFGKASSAAKGFDDMLKQYKAPVDFAADSVQRAVKDVRPYGYFVLMLDGNLVVQVLAADDDENIEPAAEVHLDELARTALTAVRDLATTA